MILHCSSNYRDGDHDALEADASVCCQICLNRRQQLLRCRMNAKMRKRIGLTNPNKIPPSLQQVAPN